MNPRVRRGPATPRSVCSGGEAGILTRSANQQYAAVRGALAPKPRFHLQGIAHAVPTRRHRRPRPRRRAAPTELGRDQRPPQADARSPRHQDRRAGGHRRHPRAPPVGRRHAGLRRRHAGRRSRRWPTPASTPTRSACWSTPRSAATTWSRPPPRIVSGNLGLSDNCQNFDVANACLAFLNGMDIASRMIERGEIDYALVVDGETANLAYEKTLERLQRAGRHRRAVPQRAGHADAGLRRRRDGAGARRTRARARRATRAASPAPPPSGTSLCRGNLDRMVTDTRMLLIEGLKLAQKTFAAAQAWRWAGWSTRLDEFVIHQVSQVHTAGLRQGLRHRPEEGADHLRRARQHRPGLGADRAVASCARWAA